MSLLNIYTMEQSKQLVEHYYYFEAEWNRLGCGPLPPERDRGNPATDGTKHQRIQLAWAWSL